MTAVAFDVPAEVAFDYLADPRHRPEWQSSLRRVELLDDRVAVGQRWIDVTVTGMRPRMETTALERPTTWTEAGRWGGVEAVLTLRFTAAGEGCVVEPEFSLSGRGAARVALPVLRLLAVPAVRSDLRRAARILSRRRSGH
jgi:uncharacterized protein YndB with AHSA1/START domain